jgi:Putative capsular polysaccharide synthesis protein
VDPRRNIVLRSAFSHPLSARLAGPALLRRRPPADVVVAQMGKVGSQAVTASLRAAGLEVAHVHFLTRSELRRAERIYRRNWDPRRLPWHIWEGHRVLARLRAGARLDIVTLVREPVARNVSSFFQVADLQFGIDLARWSAGDGTSSLDDLFLDCFDEHDLPLRWLDDQLRVATGVDVYATDFDTDRGWVIVEGTRARVLVLRTDRLAETFTSATEAFLGRQGPELVNRNLSSDKESGDLYERFRTGVVLPQPYLDQQYNSKYARHFWTDTELDAFRGAWSAREVAQ